MRFLVFNAVVAAALVYLFTAGSDPASRAGPVVGKVKALATEAIGDMRARLDKPAAPVVKPEATPAAKPVAKTVVTRAAEPVPVPPPAPKPAPQAKPLPASQAPVAEAHAEILPKPAPGPMPVVPPAPVKTVTVAEIAAPGPEDQQPAPPPDVIKRRAEVLAEPARPTAANGGAIEIGGDGLLMTVAERRKALLRLSEDMELFSIGATGQ